MAQNSESDTDFNTIIRKKGDFFFLFMPEWNLIVEGSDLNAAYAEILRQRAAISKRLHDAGLEHELPRPRKRFLFPPRSEGRPFSTTPIVVSLMIIASALLVAPAIIVKQIKSFQDTAQHIVMNVSEQIRTVANETSSAQLAQTTSNLIIKTATVMDEITPEKRAAVQQSIRTIVKNLRPFVSDLRPLFDAELTTKLEPTTESETGSPP